MTSLTPHCADDCDNLMTGLAFFASSLTPLVIPSVMNADFSESAQLPASKLEKRSTLFGKGKIPRFSALLNIL